RLVALPVLRCIDQLAEGSGVAGIGWRWWALVGTPPPFTPEKGGSSHQICPNGRFGSDLV
ncbi:hypothetical protein ACQX3P_11590, partial [Corynebacterium diphtheriae]